MKIAEVTATFPPYHGGVGNVVYHNAKFLAEKGHSVSVFTQRPKQMRDLGNLPFSVRYLDSLLTIGNAPLLRQLSASLQGFDLIHLHYPFIFGSETVLYTAKRRNIPVLLTYHNQLVEQSLMRKFLFGIYNLVVEPQIINHATYRISVSQDHFHSLFPGVESTEVPNGVDVNLFSPHERDEARRILDLPKAAPIVLFVGGLDAAHRFKNVPSLLRAASKLPEAEIIVVGQGELRKSLVQLAHDLGIAERTRFDEACPTTRLPLYYSAADVTVLPSNRTESFGMVLAESMACETPVIATNLPGVRRVVRHQETGLLVPINHDEALHGAMQWMLQHDSERRAMGRAGRMLVQQEYSWSVIQDKLEAACLKTVANHSRYSA